MRLGLKRRTIVELAAVVTATAAVTLSCTAERAPATPKPGEPPLPVQEALVGGPYPTLILAQAWFWKDEAGKPKPGPARLQIWRQTDSGWTATRLEDAESNVFHKPILMKDGSIVTIGAERAILKRWRYTGGKWTGETLWQREWGGKFNRLRDIEIGDVDGDGKDEYVIATHDQGVVAVYNPPENGQPKEVIELDRQPDTFVHEIEIGDVDGDGRLEFFATPSARNKVGVSQTGQIVMYRYDAANGKYVRSVVDPLGATHAKEILVADVDGDGRQDLLGAIEAQLEDKRVVHPVQIRHYLPRKDGTFGQETIATIDDRQCRFLIPGDYDGDGQLEVVAAAMKKGLFLLDKKEKGAGKGWSIEPFDADSSGFEHAGLAADLDGDGKDELYVAADDQRSLNRYVFDAEGVPVKTRIGGLEPSVITWNLAAGRL